MPYIDFNVAVMRLFIAFIASAVFGLERQLRTKPVGFGTFTFVCTGSCLLTIVSLNYGESANIISGIITGIGFLGAGALIRFQDRKVFGFTTAAAIWSFAALGIAVGIGLIRISLIFYLLIFLLVLVDYYFERYGFGFYSKNLFIVFDNIKNLREAERELVFKHKVLSYSFNNAEKEFSLTALISGTKAELNVLITEIGKKSGVKAIRIE